MMKTQIIDRRKNTYYERVVDPATGEVVHHCDEPLTSHQGHGDAKQPKGSRAMGQLRKRGDVWWIIDL
jgi:hypothetical protein